MVKIKLTKKEIETPCIKKCRLDRETSICKGCGRADYEISSWSMYSNVHRKNVMERIKREQYLTQ